MKNELEISAHPLQNKMNENLAKDFHDAKDMLWKLRQTPKNYLVKGTNLG